MDKKGLDRLRKLSGARISSTSLIGYKKGIDRNGNTTIITLLLDGCKIVCTGERKMRANKALVLLIEDDVTGKRLPASGSWKSNGVQMYVQGCRAYPDKFDPNVNETCSNGIHFFLNRRDAEGFVW